jgi:hypothetical protein
MKTAIWIVVGVLVIGTPIALYFWQRWRQKKIDQTGVVVYATVVAMAPVKMLGKHTDMVKITMWIQEPEKERRDVSLRTRLPAGQKIEPGMRLPVVIDPKSEKKVYPATEESLKRVVLTGPRRERRMMRTGRGVQRPNAGGGYQPPRTGGRRG